MKTTLTPVYNFLIGFLLAAVLPSCHRNSYPCPDIRGGTEVVKAGSKEGLKKIEPDVDENGRLAPKPYSHAGMKKKKR